MFFCSNSLLWRKKLWKVGADRVGRDLAQTTMHTGWGRGSRHAFGSFLPCYFIGFQIPLLLASSQDQQGWQQEGASFPRLAGFSIIPEDARSHEPCLPGPSLGPSYNSACSRSQALVLLVAPCCWSQPHSLGDDRIVEQGVPALLDLPKGEAAAELHAQVDRCQVIGLQGPRWVGPSLRATPRVLLG